MARGFWYECDGEDLAGKRCEARAKSPNGFLPHGWLSRDVTDERMVEGELKRASSAKTYCPECARRLSPTPSVAQGEVRCKAEVDEDIASIVRGYHVRHLEREADSSNVGFDCWTSRELAELNALVREAVR